jgi:DNA-binding transcriptional MerR regulator
MADGHGSHRLWSDEDVLNLKIIVSLEDVGIKPAAVKRLIPTIVGSGSVTIEKPYVTLVVEKP